MSPAFERSRGEVYKVCVLYMISGGNGNSVYTGAFRKISFIFVTNFLLQSKEKYQIFVLLLLFK